MTEPHVHGELDALLDGALDAARRQAVEAHVKSCAECATALDATRRVAHAVAEVPVPDPGEAYWARFADRVEARLAPRLAPQPEPVPVYERLLHWLVPAGRWGWVGTASVLATATLVVYVGMRGYKPQPASMPNGMEGVQRPHRSQELGVPPQSAPAPAPEPAPEHKPQRTAPAPAPRSLDTKSSDAPHAARDTRMAVPPPAPGAPVAAKKKVQAPPAPVASVQEQVQLQTAPADEKQRGDDPVLGFAHEFLLGSRAAAGARYAALVKDDLAVVPDADRTLVRSWSAAGPVSDDALAVAPSAKAQKDFASKEPAGAMEGPRKAMPPPARNDLAPQKLSAGAAESLDALAPPPSRAQLQILDALVWPRREEPGARDAVGALAHAWQRYAGADAPARARTRELATWLADTSPSSDERARWEAVRDGAADR